MATYDYLHFNLWLTWGVRVLRHWMVRVLFLPEIQRVDPESGPNSPPALVFERS